MLTSYYPPGTKSSVVFAQLVETEAVSLTVQKTLKSKLFLEQCSRQAANVY